jgi:Tfp pilus assembly protein PilF
MGRSRRRLEVAGPAGLLCLVLVAACATAGPRDGAGTAQAGPDLRATEMGALFARIDAARAQDALPALQAELDAAAADRTAWSVVQAAWVRRLSDPDTAWAHLREVTVTTGGQGGAAYWAFMGMADISLGWAIPDQARLQVEQALAIAPGSAPAVARAGLLAWEGGDVDGATALFAEALAAEDGPLVAPVAAVMMARIARDGGDVAAARGHLDAVLAHHPMRVEALVLQADLATEAGDAASATSFLERAAGAAPRDTELRIRLAEHLSAAGASEAALSAWQVVTVHRPEDVAAWRRLSVLAAELGDPAVEAEALSRIVLLDADEVDALHRLARLQAEAGDVAGAVATYEDLLFRRPDDLAARLARARLHLDAQNLREAIADLREAAEGEGSTADEARVLLEEVAARVGLTGRPVSGRSPDAIYAAVSRVVQRGYRARLTERPDLAGTYSVKVVVRGGAVIDAEVVADDLDDPILGALIFWTIHDARFPAAGGVQEFTLPFTLGP